MANKVKGDLMDDLRKRGIVHDMMQGTDEQLRKELTGAYVGVDATAPSLHIGNLATYMVLKHLQKAGHRPYIILGGGTSMVGDPSFRAKGRDAMDIERLRHNEACLKKQLEALFEVGTGSSNAVVLNNYDWLGGIPFLTFLRDVGKYVTVNYMMGKEAVKTRMETGMTYTEFAYQLLQGYDFYHLYTNHGVKMQIGGADQWANITTGAELIRKKGGGTAFGLTTPLITRADGSKFGKSADGENIWLDPTMTSPYQFYQFWLNRSDEEAKTCIYRMTLHEIAYIEGVVQEHENARHKRLLQRALAKSLTCMIHGEEAYQQAVEASEILFGDRTMDSATIADNILLEALAGVPEVKVSAGALAAAEDVLTFLTTASQGLIFSSKREAREMIKAGAVRINKQRVTDPGMLLKEVLQWREGAYWLVQKGKKNYFLVRRV